MRRKVSEDVNMFKETKLFMYSSRGNHGHVTKKNNYTKNFRNILLFNLVDTSKPKKLSARSNPFWELGSRVPPLFPALLGALGYNLDATPDVMLPRP